jgi:hypothetical protein
MHSSKVSSHLQGRRALAHAWPQAPPACPALCLAFPDQPGPTAQPGGKVWRLPSQRACACAVVPCSSLRVAQAAARAVPELFAAAGVTAADVHADARGERRAALARGVFAVMAASAEVMSERIGVG